MPVYIKKSRVLVAREDLKRRLVEEWKEPREADLQEPRPTIIHEQDDQGVVVHVYVVWEEWEGLSQEDRSEVITAAYWEAFDVKGLALTVAMGLTLEEGRRMGLDSSPQNT